LTRCRNHLPSRDPTNTVNMTDWHGLFESPEAFREGFVNRLERMLREYQGLGVFILVLANASYDEGIYRRLATPLRQRFEDLAARMRADLQAGRPLGDAPDDVLVFLKLMAVGFDDLPLTRFRQADGFELQFNLLRAFRPARMSDAVVKELHKPFDPSGFHFNKPFLQKEVFWEGELLGRQCRLLYNKFPFAELHALLVIDPQDDKPQWLRENDHLAIWEITEALGRSLPGVGFAYNAYGAFSSVNHQHFQMFVRAQGEYPVESADWRHAGGEEAYPLECHCFDDVERAWAGIRQLHQEKRAYNLLYRPGRLYVLPRKFQGSYRHSSWTSGFAWSEVCGAVTTFNAEDFTALDGRAIRDEMARLKD